MRTFNIGQLPLETFNGNRIYDNNFKTGDIYSIQLEYIISYEKLLSRGLYVEGEDGNLIEQDRDIINLYKPTFEYKEEVFVKIIEIVGDKYVVEFYDFFGDDNILQRRTTTNKTVQVCDNTNNTITFCVPDKIIKSMWLKSGDRITCKRNNFHFTLDPIQEETISSHPISGELTNWGGVIINPEILDHLCVGNVIRCNCSTECGGNRYALYFQIVKILENNKFLVIPYELYDYFTEILREYIGNFFIVDKNSIQELFLDLDENQNLRQYEVKKTNKYGQYIGYRITGIRDF